MPASVPARTDLNATSSCSLAVVFDPPLDGLVLAEAEFATDAGILVFQPPHYTVADHRRRHTGVPAAALHGRRSHQDPRFAGGRLAGTSREQLISWLTDYGINLSAPPAHSLPW